MDPKSECRLAWGRQGRGRPPKESSHPAAQHEKSPCNLNTSGEEKLPTPVWVNVCVCISYPGAQRSQMTFSPGSAQTWSESRKSLVRCQPPPAVTAKRKELKSRGGPRAPAGGPQAPPATRLQPKPVTATHRHTAALHFRAQFCLPNIHLVNLLLHQEDVEEWLKL